MHAVLIRDIHESEVQSGRKGGVYRRAPGRTGPDDKQAGGREQGGGSSRYPLSRIVAQSRQGGEAKTWPGKPGQARARRPYRWRADSDTHRCGRIGSELSPFFGRESLEWMVGAVDAPNMSLSRMGPTLKRAGLKRGRVGPAARLHRPVDLSRTAIMTVPRHNGEPHAFLFCTLFLLVLVRLLRGKDV